jgi:hypothetical protein
MLRRCVDVPVAAYSAATPYCADFKSFLAAQHGFGGAMQCHMLSGLVGPPSPRHHSTLHPVVYPICIQPQQLPAHLSSVGRSRSILGAPKALGRSILRLRLRLRLQLHLRLHLQLRLRRSTMLELRRCIHHANNLRMSDCRVMLVEQW